MALLIDESVPSVQDLLRCDGSLMDVAGAEGIDLQSKLSMARAAIVTRLQIFLRDRGEQPTAIESVVVTEPLERWITLSAISLAFRDGHFRHLSDRYKEKWLLYDKLAENAREDLMRMGIGRTRAPIRRPTIGVTTAVSGSLAEGSYAVAISAVNEAGEESEASEVATLYLSDGGGIRFESPVLMDAALRWNVYAGRTVEDLHRQNETPLASTSAMVLQSLQNYGRPSKGQQPTIYTNDVRSIRRG
jgi:hypothetical protein